MGEVDNEENLENEEIPKCCALQIISNNDNHCFVLNETVLEKLLMREEIRDRYAVVISVAGAFRKGKSFLLDFFIKYLDAKYKKQDVSDWLGPDDIPLEGFSWKGGSERVTAGILIWSDIYLTTIRNNTEVAILLLDTQGAFDSSSTVCECATIFALSTMVSSVQIYNISQNIQEDDLQHLELFAEYGRLALADCGRVPFQKLLFLVRDWSFPYEAKYGIDGGQKILDKRLQIKSGQHLELQYLRRHIKSCFTEISCYLMPHPGLMVASNPKFDGRLSDIEPEFKKYVKILAPLVLAPENLTIKKVSGQYIKAKELLLYFKTYTKIFSGNELPEPKSMLVATAEANHLSALTTAKDNYVLGMEEVCNGNAPYLNPKLLENHHLRYKTEAINYFGKKRKMGGDELSESYRKLLITDIDKIFEQYKAHNEGKNLFKTGRTPAVFMVLAILNYFASSVFALIGLTNFAFLCNVCTLLSVITLITWSYTRYSGENIEINNLIDLAADKLWIILLKPVYISLTQKSFEETLSAATSRIDLVTDKLTNNYAESNLQILN